MDFGFRIAKEVSRLEIGQTVVVKDGTVLAVEGFEGTDKCLARGGELAGPAGGAVAVKVAREKHDLRFDIPCLGPQTLETCAGGAHCRACLRGRQIAAAGTRDLRALARKHKIAVTTVG